MARKSRKFQQRQAHSSRRDPYADFMSSRQSTDQAPISHGDPFFGENTHSCNDAVAGKCPHTGPIDLLYRGPQGQNVLHRAVQQVCSSLNFINQSNFIAEKCLSCL